MSKRHGKSRQTNPNRARSKNNPDGKRNDPKTDWPEYNKGRRSEGRRFVRWMRQIAEIAREILGIAPGTHDRRASAMTVSIIIKGEVNLSYWGLIKHFDRHPDDLELCELYRPYCRTWYQLRMSEIDPAVLQKIITKMAGDEVVHGILLVDSSGFSIAKYIDWLNAKYGKISVRLFSKLHIMHTLHGMVCAADAPGKVNDQPHLRQMIEMLPEGDGDVLADAAYGGVKNCDAIRDGGRRAVIDIKSNAVIKGFNARAEMLRFREEHPGTFHRILRLRNNVESVFSSMKARFGGVVRALRETTPSAELLSMTICYSMAFA